MLRLSELSGFLVGGIVREKIVLKNIGEKSRQKTATENPSPSKLWGGVICGVVVHAEDILHFAIRDYQINLSH